MRSVVIRRGAALLALVILLAVAPAAIADDPNPFEPPGARLQPPIGAPSQAEEPSYFDLFLILLEAGVLLP